MNKLRTLITALGAGTLLAGAGTLPAHADEDGWRRHEWREHERAEWREHEHERRESCERHPYECGRPAVVYETAPPPVVVTPPPAFVYQPAPPPAVIYQPTPPGLVAPAPSVDIIFPIHLH